MDWQPCLMVLAAAFFLTRLWLWDILLAPSVYWSSHIKATDIILLLQQTEIGPRCTCRLYCKMLLGFLSFLMVLVCTFSVSACCSCRFFFLICIKTIVRPGYDLLCLLVFNSSVYKVSCASLAVFKILHLLTHYSLYSVYYTVNYMGNDRMRFRTLRRNFLNIIASADELDIHVMHSGVPSIM